MMDAGPPARPPIIPPRPGRPPPPPAWLHTSDADAPDIATPAPVATGAPAAPASASAFASHHQTTTSLSSSTRTGGGGGGLEVSFDLREHDHSRSSAPNAGTAAGRSYLSLTPGPSQPASPTSAAHHGGPSSSPPAAPGRPLPPELDSSSYTLLSLLGQGGFAAVYRALYHPSGREVAVKVFDLEAQWCAYMEKGDELDEILSAGPGASASGAAGMGFGVPRRRQQQRRGMRERNEKYRMEEVWREVSVTANLRHPNICKFSYCFASTPASHQQQQRSALTIGIAPSPHPSASVSASPSPCQPSSRAQQHSLQVPLGAASPMSPLSPSPSPPLHPSSPSSCSRDPALQQQAQAHSQAQQCEGAALSSATLGGFSALDGAGEPAQFCVVMPLCEGSLKQLLSSLYPLGIKDDATLACILHPLLSVLAYLHSSSNHKIHRDIKLDNILLDRRASIMLADWGIAQDFWSERGTVGPDGTLPGEEADGDEAGSDSEEEGEEAAAAAAAAEEEAAHRAAAARAAEMTLGVGGAHVHSRSPSSPKPSVSGVAVGSLRGKSRRAQALAAAKAKFAGTPIMMAPELLEQAGLSSILPAEALSPGGHLRHASAQAASGTGSAAAAAAAAAAAVGSPARRGSLLALGRNQDAQAQAAIAKRYRSASAVALSDTGSPSSQAQAAAWAASAAALGSSSFRRSQSFRSAASIRAKCDIWSLGITALELAFGAPPHASSPAAQAHDPLHLRKLILDAPAPTVASCAREFAQAQAQLPAPLAKEALHAPLFGFSKHFHDFIAQALVKDPARRASAAQLLAHPFIKKYYSAKTTTVTPPPPLPPMHAEATAAAANGSASAATAAAAADRGPLVVHKLLYERLLEPWQRLVRERRVREEKERKEAERLAKKSLSKSQMRALALQQAQEALLAGAAQPQQQQVQVQMHALRPPPVAVAPPPTSASSPRHAASNSASAIFPIPAPIAEAHDG